MKYFNEYSSSISTYYDEIVSRYYYDYKAYSSSLENLLKGRGKDLFEVGIGTGLAAFFMVKKGFNVSGIDISHEMLKEARKRLGQAIELICANIKEDLTKQLSNTKFDAAFSVGGAWFITKDSQNKLALTSHIDSDEDNKAGLLSLFKVLKNGAPFAISIQKPHETVSRLPLEDGLFYSHTVLKYKDESGKNHLRKDYKVCNGSEEVASQRCIFREYNEEELFLLLKEAGFLPPSRIRHNDVFLVVRKPEKRTYFISNYQGPHQEKYAPAIP